MKVDYIRIEEVSKEFELKISVHCGDTVLYIKNLIPLDKVNLLIRSLSTGREVTIKWDGEDVIFSETDILLRINKIEK